MVLDVYSRKIVGHEVHVAESAELAALLMRKASLAEGLAGRKVVLHSDNGSAMKGAILATLEKLGVVLADRKLVHQFDEGAISRRMP